MSEKSDLSFFFLIMKEAEYLLNLKPLVFHHLQTVSLYHLLISHWIVDFLLSDFLKSLYVIEIIPVQYELQLFPF